MDVDFTTVWDERSGANVARGTGNGSPDFISFLILYWNRIVQSEGSGGVA